MAKYSHTDRDAIDALVDRLRPECLIADGSLIFPDAAVWTLENFDQLHAAYNDRLEMEGLEGTFDEKFKVQIGEEPTAVKRLAAEIMAVYLLFASHNTVGAAKKRELINTILGWNQESLPADSDVSLAMGHAIGGPGQAYNNLRWRHIAYLVALFRELKRLPEDARAALLQDAWEFKSWAVQHDGGEQMMRQILLHLLFPNEFERIASGPHKHRIVDHLEGLLDDLPADDPARTDVDRGLLAIRRRLEQLRDENTIKLAPQIDFYEGLPKKVWDPPMVDLEAAGGLTNLAALEIKRQIVLYGPPGTGKTYEAKGLASRLLHAFALKRWGPVAYLTNYEQVDQIAADQVRRLQLHQAYSYEDFIRGLRLTDGGGTVPVDGYLLGLCDEINAARQETNGLQRLPWVLVLDELNRTDVSRLFGEVFSLLEDRDAEVDLPMLGEGGKRRSLSLPRDLYVIGTMNLIDQSVEQLDFALRRRFLWIRSGFVEHAIPEVLQGRWEATEYAGHHPWHRIAGDIEKLARHAAALNAEITSSRLLGEQYEVGHTYFFDVVEFLQRWDLVRKSGQRPTNYLWTDAGQPRPPLEDLWEHSLRPLLHEYLAGVDAQTRQEELTALRRVLITGKR